MADELTHEEFFAHVRKPEVGDQMTLALERTAETQGQALSLDGIDNLIGQMRAFVMARMAAEHARTGKMPSKIKLNVDVGFDPLTETQKNYGSPWWSGRDPGSTLFDGTYRESGLKSLREIVDE